MAWDEEDEADAVATTCKVPYMYVLLLRQDVGLRGSGQGRKRGEGGAQDAMTRLVLFGAVQLGTVDTAGRW